MGIFQKSFSLITFTATNASPSCLKFKFNKSSLAIQIEVSSNIVEKIDGYSFIAVIYLMGILSQMSLYSYAAIICCSNYVA